MSIQYSNPRRLATIEGWPYGQLRTTATFTVEGKTGRERVSRITINPKTGKPTAPKTTTYGIAALIFDGDNGRTYIGTLTHYGQIYIMRGDMQFSEESLFADDPRYAPMHAALAAPRPQTP